MDEIAVKAGKLLVFSCGEYSDYGYIGQFVALRDIPWATIQDTADTHQRRYEREDDYYSPQVGFVADMIAQGFLLEVDMQEIYLGSYGECRVSR